MARPALMDTLTRIAEPVVASLGLEIWGVEILQAGRPVVRIYVDAPHRVAAAQGAPAPVAEDDAPEAQALAPAASGHASAESVSIDQCAKISRMVGLALEVENVFPSAYVIEVSSPGLSRVFFRLDQLAAYVGDMVDLTLLEAHPDWLGRKKFRGRLCAVEGDRITLAVESGAENVDPGEQSLELRWEDVRKAARVHVFPERKKPGQKKRADT